LSLGGVCRVCRQENLMFDYGLEEKPWGFAPFFYLRYNK